MTEILITFAGPQSRFQLTYELLETPLAQRWLSHLRAALQLGQATKEDVFIGATFVDKPTILQEMLHCIEVINNYGHDHIALVPFDGMELSLLNELHGIFETLGSSATYHVNACPREVFDAVSRLNIVIHQYECVFYPDTHLVITQFRGARSAPLLPEDYSLFTADNQFGWMYLDYATIGIQPLVAFYNKPTDPPVSQSTLTPGFLLSFRSDHKFDRQQEVKQFLREHYGMDSENPRLAIGYIPLAKPRLNGLSRAKILGELAKHQRIEKIEIREPRAIYPMDRVLLHHLDLVPYLQLETTFDHAACLSEALSLLPRFVEHRKYDQISETGGKWKSLALRSIDGDSRKTEYHTTYGIADGEDIRKFHRLTDVAALCPETMRFLCSITDLDECMRIRFMLLEPGAKIAVHSDSPECAVQSALNIALNMPVGCEFFIEANPDGTHNRFTRKIPFHAGTAMIVNVAKYHYVHNRSNEPRIHIIVHGPLRYKEAALFEAAYRQNQLRDERELVGQLILKYSELGRSVESNTPLFADFRRVGLSPDSLPSHIRLAVIHKEIPQRAELDKECLHHITRASLFPLAHEVVPFATIDEWLRRETEQGYEFAILVLSGTYVANVYDFLMEGLKAIGQMNSANVPLMGHILDHAANDRDLPYLHPQFALVNLNLWRQLGYPSMGAPAGQVDFPAFERAEENIHDDYTPLWIVPAETQQPRVGEGRWGTQFLASALAGGHRILNLPHTLRATKSFAYPENDDSKNYVQVKEQIKSVRQHNRNFIYYFNNEPLRVKTIPGFAPQELITVAAGFKPAALAQQYWPDRSPQRVLFLDHSAPALEYWKRLANCTTEQEVLYHIVSAMQRNSDHACHSESYVRENLQQELRNSFAGQFTTLRKALDQLRAAEYVHGSFIVDPDFIVGRINPESRVLFWHSNAWSCNDVLFDLTAAEIEQNYRLLAQRIAERTGLQVWKHKHHYELLFGPSLDSTHIVFTDGAYADQAFCPTNYERLSDVTHAR